jgi:transcriptional regulator with XRE-family HTH domain
MLRVKQLAEEKGWNISRLSEASGVSYPQTLSIWHNRTRRFDADTMKRIADALEVPVWQLYDNAPGSPLQERVFRKVQRLFPDMPEHHQVDLARWLEDFFYENLMEKILKDYLYQRYKTIGDRWAEEALERVEMDHKSFDAFFDELISDSQGSTNGKDWEPA